MHGLLGSIQNLPRMSAFNMSFVSPKKETLSTKMKGLEDLPAPRYGEQWRKCTAWRPGIVCRCFVHLARFLHFIFLKLNCLL